MGERIRGCRGARTGRGCSLLPAGQGALGALSAIDLHIRRKQKKQSLILSKPNNIMYID